MIIDLPKFIASEQPYWKELGELLNRMELQPDQRLTLDQTERFHYLFERTASDLARLGTFASEPETRRLLETLVGRAYGEIHESRQAGRRWNLRRWLFVQFPQTFRRHIRAFALSVAITLVGTVFGGAAIAFDPAAKAILMPFPHLQGPPEERVAAEEAATEGDPREEGKASFSAFLMTHNTQVAILTLALGVTWAAGTILILFSNGVMLGAVIVDYVRAGQSVFLTGWLLPHGSFEIPAILIAGQAGLVLGRALIGTRTRKPVTRRLREVSDDLITLIGGVAVMLIWAGFVESFFSQYHQPVIPYWAKILFGLVELTVLTLFLWKAGVESETKLLSTQANRLGHDPRSR